MILATALLVLPVSCTKETEDDPGGGIPLRVVPSFAGETKASMQTSDLQEFYLHLNCADAAFRFFGKMSKSGTAWSAGKQLLWKDETTPITACAAYFGGHAFTAAEFSAGVNLAVPTDQHTQAGLNSADLLTQPAASARYMDTTDGEFPVTLDHGLAKVNFVLSLRYAIYDANIGRTENPVTDFTVKGTNTGFSFNPQTGAVSVRAGTQADITPLAGTYTPGTATAKTATALYEAILVPQSIAAGNLKITFSIGSGEYEWTNTESITLAAGRTYNLQLNTNTAPSPYQFVNMGSGLKWAKCNVGANNPQDYGLHFAWAETTTKSRYNWGTYQWMEFGRSDWDYITKYTFADGYTDGRWYNGNTFMGDGWLGVEHRDYASYGYADDAARQIWGGKWRTPTAAEWTWLRENCTWSWTTLSGVNGMLVTSNINGNQIFLPAAGYRYNADLLDSGSYGYYWSSSLFEAKSYFATSVYFSNSGVFPGWDQRFFGQSVRPVKN